MKYVCCFWDLLREGEESGASILLVCSGMLWCDMFDYARDDSRVEQRIELVCWTKKICW